MTSKRSDGIHQLDPNMRLPSNRDENWQWFSPQQAPFHLAGFPWLTQEKRYRRLPTQPKWTLPKAVDSLANCTAGGQIRFVTDSSRLAIRVTLAAPAGMYHMPATGQCGFDCYIGEPGKQRYFSTTRYDHTQTQYQCALIEGAVASRKTITLNFPLYQGVQSVEIGLAPQAEIAPPPAYESDGKVIFYGTSITQGGCAARPGMAFTNILSRRINREFINLGFSGNGKGEPELAHIISEIENPALYVLDYDANVPSVESMAQTLPEFIHILRKSHANIPILVISRVPTSKEFFSESARNVRIGKAQAQRETVQRLRAAGDDNLVFLDGADIYDETYAEGTVDGSHPTDLGFWLTANALEPIIRKLLNT